MGSKKGSLIWVKTYYIPPNKQIVVLDLSYIPMIQMLHK